MAFELSGHSNSYHTYTLDDALEGIANAGFPRVELSAVRGWTEHVPVDASDEQVREIRAKLDHYGLRASVLSGHSDLTTADGLSDGQKAAATCHKFGLPILVTAIGGHYKEGEDKDAFMRHIRTLANDCRALGLTIGLEVHGEIMATGAASAELIEEIDEDNVRITYDTANCEFYGGVKAVDDIETVLPYLCHVHVKDKAGAQDAWNFPAVGEGNVDFAGVLDVLRTGGYDGGLSVEIEFEGEPWPPVEEVHRSMRAAYDELGRLGAK